MSDKKDILFITSPTEGQFFNGLSFRNVELKSLSRKEVPEMVFSCVEYVKEFNSKSESTEMAGRLSTLKNKFSVSAEMVISNNGKNVSAETKGSVDLIENIGTLEDVLYKIREPFPKTPIYSFSHLVAESLVDVPSDTILVTICLVGTQKFVVASQSGRVFYSKAYNETFGFLLTSRIIPLLTSLTYEEILVVAPESLIEELNVDPRFKTMGIDVVPSSDLVEDKAEEGLESYGIWVQGLSKFRDVKSLIRKEFLLETQEEKLLRINKRRQRLNIILLIAMMGISFGLGLFNFSSLGYLKEAQSINQEVVYKNSKLDSTIRALGGTVDIDGAVSIMSKTSKGLSLFKEFFESLPLHSFELVEAGFHLDNSSGVKNPKNWVYRFRATLKPKMEGTPISYFESVFKLNENPKFKYKIKPSLEGMDYSISVVGQTSMGL